MAQTYTFELTFTGLCIFTFEGDKRKPKSVNALLVNATGAGNGHPGGHGGGNGGVHVHSEEDAHLPRLTFDTRNLAGFFPEPHHQLLPGVAGTPLGTMDLSKWFVTVFPEVKPLPPLEAEWRPEGTKLPPEPAQPEDEKWLDWTMALQRMNQETPDPSAEMPLAGLRKEKMIAAVRIPCGHLAARRFMRLQDSWKYVRWDFRPPGPQGEDSDGGFAMAENVVLSIRDVPTNRPVRITNDDEKFKLELKPARRPDGSFEDVVRASVTNLPTKAVPTQELPEYLHHFEYFYQAVDFGQVAPAPFRFPHPNVPVAAMEAVTRENSYCPPTSHTRAD